MSTDPDEVRLGQINYAAYCAAVDHKTWDDRPVPTWDKLTEKIRAAWCAGAVAVTNTVNLEAATGRYLSER